MQWSSVCLVRNNAAALGRVANSFADAFLDRFVRQCPELSRTLTFNREARRKELLDTFAGILKHAANTHALSTRLTVLAATNERRGVRPHHYDRARDILLELLAEYNGAGWSTELARAWDELIESMLIHLSPPQSFDEAIAA